MSMMIDRTHRLEQLLRGDVPLIAVSFSDAIPSRDIAEAKAAGLDVAELRIDRYSSHDEAYVLDHVRKFSGLPTIATIRTQDEGGEWIGSDEDRLSLFKAILPEVHGVDIELSSTRILPELVAAAKSLDRVVIVSNHNFEVTPPMEQLRQMATDAKALGADYVKLSAMTHSQQDVGTLAEFTVQNARLGLIVIAMGPFGGPISRVFFPALGSRLTYAHVGHYAVSGQLDYETTFDLLRRFYPQFDEKKIIELRLLDDA